MHDCRIRLYYYCAELVLCHTDNIQYNAMHVSIKMCNIERFTYQYISLLSYCSEQV